MVRNALIMVSQLPSPWCYNIDYPEINETDIDAVQMLRCRPADYSQVRPITALTLSDIRTIHFALPCILLHNDLEPFGQ